MTDPNPAPEEGKLPDKPMALWLAAGGAALLVWSLLGTVGLNETQTRILMFEGAKISQVWENTRLGAAAGAGLATAGLLAWFRRR